MDEFFEKSILFDIYGGLLGKNQKLCYEYHIMDDLSFNEIGEEMGITRQAAYELYKHADKKLYDLEKKLMLRERFREIEKCATEINSISQSDKIINLSNKIIKLTLKGGKN